MLKFPFPLRLCLWGHPCFSWHMTKQKRIFGQNKRFLNLSLLYSCGHNPVFWDALQFKHIVLGRLPIWGLWWRFATHTLKRNFCILLHNEMVDFKWFSKYKIVMLSPPMQQVFLISILIVVEETGTHYLNICYMNSLLQSVIKQLNRSQWKENWQYTLIP